LEGHDREWVEAGNRRSAFYTNLKPGEYSFQVQACNADGVWSRSRTLALTLRPHFYQQGWFIGAAIAALLTAMAGIVKWRGRRLAQKQDELKKTNEWLEKRVRERTLEMAAINASLKNEIEERKRMEAEVSRVHRQLVDASRQAGQADVASSVLHNVGNVLNSVNISASILSEHIRKLRLGNLGKAAQLMRERRGDLVQFLTQDARGRQLPDYLGVLSEQLSAQQAAMLAEMQELTGSIDHIKEIVSMQQSLASFGSVIEKVPVVELVENALKMHVGAFQRHGLHLVRDYQDRSEITVDRHKVLQILVNLLHNAKYACEESNVPDKRVTVRTCREGDRIRIEVSDNGIGIPAENMKRLFTHGFTTRRNGHGYGLHSSVLAARELGGDLTAHSDGHLTGATFTLEVPVQAQRVATAPGEAMYDPRAAGVESLPAI
jgi:C4-dicarboxylate-specific signal transduction histidine kinase